MEQKKQRITIAEACGWKPDDDGDGTGWKGSRIRQRLIGKKPTFRDGKVVSYLIEQNVPDYLNDLNAMHDAENAVKHCWGKYVKTLNGFADPACATASQRAEAFLKTFNLWDTP